jgi:hypothetical protein
MYGSGATVPINRGNGGVPKMYGGVPMYGMYGNAQVPPPMYEWSIPRPMYPSVIPDGAVGIPILHGNRRVIISDYGNHRSKPTVYEIFRNRAGLPMRGNGASKFSKVVPDDDVGEGVPPPLHSGAPDSMPNGDEEEYCDGKLVCKIGEYTCLGSCTCIPAAWRCDGDADCAAEEDEVECGDNLQEEPDEDCNTDDGKVRCPRTGKCIRSVWQCDGEDDCGDFSDETDCGKHSR